MFSSYISTYRRVLFLLFSSFFLAIVFLWHYRTSLFLLWTLLNLPFSWPRGSEYFYISEEADTFDVSFASYNNTETSAGPGYSSLVPGILHHISLGPAAATRASWVEARQSCLDAHPGWQAILWTDEKAEKFIADKFASFKPTWDSYRFPIQKVDALRYLVLYEFGGVILDMDLRCKRSLGPLRRFRFVAPAAFPTGFSISFMMAERHNEFVGKLINNLEVYNRRWFYLPYPTVMFSTGGHFASVIHTLQSNRSKSKILAGPTNNFWQHSLNGPVSTPLFDHLGSASWHLYDAGLVVLLGKCIRWVLPILIIGFVCILLLVVDRLSGRVRNWRLQSPNIKPVKDLEDRWVR